jgi:outer membrane protein W
MFPMKDQKGMPYVTVGVGGYSFDPDVQGASTKTKFGANGGVGYNYMVNDMTSVGLDVGYHWISTGSDFKKADGSNATASMLTADVHVGWNLGGMSGGKKK